jgi:hypothetical protein
MVFSNENQEDLAWINLIDDSNPNPPTVSDQILHNRALCEARDFTTGSFPYNNGNNLQPVIDAFLGFDRNDQEDGACLLGQTRAAPVILCSRGGGNHRMVVGFVNIEIDAVTCSNGRVIDACPARTNNPCSQRGGGGGGNGKGGGSGGGGTSLALTLTVTCGPPVGATGGPGLKLRLVQ